MDNKAKEKKGQIVDHDEELIIEGKQKREKEITLLFWKKKERDVLEPFWENI